MLPSPTQTDVSTHWLKPGTVSTHPGVQHYIENKYRECYGADIDCTYHNLLYAIDENGQYVAAVGYRTPAETFFLEQYLNTTAETVLTQLYGEKVDRDELVEIGNLVGDNRHAVFFLMQALWRHLTERSYQHVILTCTGKLQRRFRNLPLVKITHALKDNVENPESWGSYYDHSPQVMTGRLSTYDNRFRLKRNIGKFSLGFSDDQEFPR